MNGCGGDPERLARAVYLTPYGRQVYDAAFTLAENNFDAAVNFCIQANMGYGFQHGRSEGWVEIRHSRQGTSIQFERLE
ncbi:MAG: hypothetical protein V8Q32_07345 [Anaerotignum faecicola]